MKYKFSWVKTIIVFCLILFWTLICIFIFGQKQTVGGVKVWQIPPYMQENLINMLNEFNQRFEGKVQGFKEELRLRVKGYGDLPADAVLDLQRGNFIRKEDLEKYMESFKEKEVKK